MIDESLVQAIGEGKIEAFRQLVEQHQRLVINICYRFVRDRSEAEDLAQETFVEVFRSIDTFRRQSDLSTWIYRIAVSKSLDLVRRQSRAKRGGKLRTFLGLDEKTAELPAPRTSQPDVVLEQQERRRVLSIALAKLPEKQRTAFILSQYDELSYQEIAGILKTTLASVESLIHRARRNLQNHLREYYEKAEKS